MGLIAHAKASIPTSYGVQLKFLSSQHLYALLTAGAMILQVFYFFNLKPSLCQYHIHFKVAVAGSGYPFAFMAAFTKVSFV
jgi:hypothetical protein